ncbi:MAG: polysaccharide biosynthesis C-terminal domain-containing protein [Clostridiales bacterium]|nr:polysaccharide biosynthesis C-terminal domain-containing protein [Clostridiales bacterium]
MDITEKRQFKKELMALAIPLALQGLLNALVGASDALMLGRLTQDAIAAVSLANQVSFVMSLFTGSVVGAVGVLVGQYWGKKDTANARRFLAMAVRYVAGISLVFFLLAFTLPTQIMGILTTEPELIRIGGEYLRIVSFSYLFSGIAQCFLMMMKVTGYAKMSLWISAVTVVVDMVVDFFLIYGMGPIPALGANGSAYSTIAVEAIALVWCLIWAQKKQDVRLDRKTLCFFSKLYEKDVWKIIPGMLASALSWGLSMTMHSFILGHLGTDATAAYSVTGVAQQLIQCLTMGLSSGGCIMLSQLMGQNQLEKAKAYGKQFWRVAFWSGVINIGLIAVVGPLVYFFYVLEPQAKIYLIQMLIFHAAYMFALSYNSVFTVGVFPAGGDSKYDAVSVFFATWCFSIPLALLGCFVFHWPVMWVYIVMCLDEIVKVPFIKRHYDKYIWLQNLTREEAESTGEEC